MENYQAEVSKKDMNKYSEYEAYQFMRSQYHQFGEVSVIRHPIQNHCVFMKELMVNRKEDLKKQIYKYNIFLSLVLWVILAFWKFLALACFLRPRARFPVFGGFYFFIRF